MSLWPALWLAVAAFGQAGALALVDAGARLHYQHYLGIAGMLETRRWAAALVAAQAAAVIAGLYARRGELRASLGRLRALQILAGALVMLTVSVAVSEDRRFFAFELAFGAAVAAINLGAIALLAWSVPQEAVESAGRWFRRLPAGRAVLFAALGAAIAAAFLSCVSYERHPHVADEASYIIQARYLAGGAIAMPAPPVPEAFSLDLMTYEPERWYSPFPPGWPALLALGALAGAPWLVNPLLTGLNLIGAWLLLRELYGRDIALGGALLLAVSPWHLFMGMSLMAHTFTLTCALAGALGVAWARKTGRARWTWLGGAAIGVASLIRPLDGFLLAGLLGLWALGLGGSRLKPSGIAGLALAAALAGAAVLPYNRALTGSATYFPVMAYFDKVYWPGSNDMGFGPERGVGWGIDPNPGHSPLDALINAQLNGFSINVELFGWGAGSLLVAAVFLFSGKLRRPDFGMLSVIAAVFLAQSLYWFSGGPDFGARYWWLMLIPLIALTARGLEALGGRARLAAAAISALAVTIFVPWRAADKYHRYLGMRPDILRLAAVHEFDRSLVFIRGDRHPDYASAAVYNPLDWDVDAPIYAWDRGPKVRARTMAAFPDRTVWMVNGPSVTGGSYELAEAPDVANPALTD